MKNLPTVSIITPCYNSASYLPACIESLTSQTTGIDNLEFIFIDDASSDDTLTVLSEFEAHFPEQVMLIPLSENQGQGFARNLALSYASGDYVLYVDSDDAIAPYALELLLKHAASLNCDILEFDFTRSPQSFPSMATAFEAVPATYRVTDSASRQIYCTSIPKSGIICNKLYRRELLTKHHIHNAQHLAHEDTLFSQLVSFYVDSYAYLPVPLYFYRLNINSTMLKGQIDDFHQFDRLKVQMQFLEECEQRGLLKDYYFAVEAMFLRTYYIDTLLFVLDRFANAPLAQLEIMQHTVQTCFPSWRNNPFLSQQQSPIEQRLFSTLDCPFTSESFHALKDIFL